MVGWVTLMKLINSEKRVILIKSVIWANNKSGAKITGTYKSYQGEGGSALKGKSV